MLVDEAEINIKAGHGGAGRVSFKGKTGGPDGGDGGRGGDVYVRATNNIYDLNQFLSRSVYRAENGEAGGVGVSSGKDGKDLFLIMPIGTILKGEGGYEVELKDVNQVILLTKGGLGGRGNESYKSSRNTTPRYAQGGLPGEEKKLKLRLRLIADLGLIGLPNVGKSSLLNELTKANAKIGDFPFTTLEPNLGVLNGKVLADIPGLIEGASVGKGLGHKFLKHIEKVRLLLHCVSSESKDPLKDYKTIREELRKFNPELLSKREIILLTKSDVKSIELKGLPFDKKVIPVSIYSWESIQSLIKTLNKYLGSDKV
jgi:GTPase